MSKPSRQTWRTGITTYGPRVLVAGALSGAVAFMTPGQGTLGMDRAHPDHGRIDIPDIGRNFKQPLSISGVLGHSPGLPSTQAVRLASAAAGGSIPGPAFAAYQRAATALHHAKQACRIDWELIAAIGMVESNHGRFGGSALDVKGVARPAIIGPELDGAGAVARVVDTDQGLYDHDTAFDRAVGPMQFLPGTWNTINADGDGDNRRDPQDIDDAALATGAYLCAGGEDLTTEAGQRAAVFRYNNSRAYVDAVMSVAEKYRRGDFAGAVVNPGGSIGNFPGTDIRRPGTQVDADGPLGTPPSGASPRAVPGGAGGPDGAGGGTPPGGGSGPAPRSGSKTDPESGSHDGPSQTPAPTPSPADAPAGGGSDDGTPAPTTPTDTPTQTQTQAPTPAPSPTEPTEPPEDTKLRTECTTAVNDGYPDAVTDSIVTKAVDDCYREFVGTQYDISKIPDYVKTFDAQDEYDDLGTYQDPATAQTDDDPDPADPTTPAGSETAAGDAS